MKTIGYKYFVNIVSSTVLNQVIQFKLPTNVWKEPNFINYQ